MRLIAMGTGPFAVPSLRALVASEHQVLKVVARPPRGRRRENDPPMVAEAAALGVEVWRPESANLPDSLEQLRDLEPDLLVVCDYGEILKDATLATARLGGINLHGSLLPKYRGAAPVQWAVLHGDAETGNSVIQMTPGLDAGPILGQQTTPIDPDETAGELEARLAELGAELTLRIVNELATGAAIGSPQNRAEATRAPRLQKVDGRIDWSRPADVIKNQVRGLHPWPRAFTEIPTEKGEPLRLVVDRVALAEGSGPAGTILMAGQRFVVATGEGGAVELLDVQPAGKRRMGADDFLRGIRPLEGLSLQAADPDSHSGPSA